METAIESSPNSTATPIFRQPALGMAAVLAALWLLLINQLRINWSIDPNYSYGWLVPFLSLYLFWKRWPARPSPERASRLPTLGILAVFLAFLLLPTRLIQESAPYWTAVSWALALEVIGLTLFALLYLGGSRWLRHFALPVCFFLVAVPWPSGFENEVTQGLMRHVASIATEILSWAGVFAIPEGNLIRVSTGLVSVDEACSGVRSLQSMLMVSLFLGELNRLSWLKRAALVFIGLALALSFNVIRILTLVSVANRDGISAVEKWHDRAGFSILVVSFLGLCLVVRLFRTRALPEDAPRSLPPTRPLPVAWLLALAAWMVVVETGTRGWYLAHERNSTAITGGWNVRWPQSLPNFQERPIPESIRGVLACDFGSNAVWRQSDGTEWLGYFFKWNPSPHSQQSARFHRPEVCLPATGRNLTEERPRVTIKMGGSTLSFRSYVFDSLGRPIHVFFSLREGAQGQIEATDMLADSRIERLRRVLEGRRGLGQQSIEVVIFGMNSAEEAEAAFREQMQEIIIPAGA